MGWLLRRHRLQDGAWLFLVTEDTESLLAGQLLVRSPMDINITVGQVTMRNTHIELDRLDVLATHHTMPIIKEANSLLPISWNQGLPFWEAVFRPSSSISLSFSWNVIDVRICESPCMVWHWHPLQAYAYKPLS